MLVMKFSNFFLIVVNTNHEIVFPHENYTLACFIILLIYVMFSRHLVNLPIYELNYVSMLFS